MSKRMLDALAAVRQAKIEDAKEQLAEDRKTYGECPSYYRHFDWPSFFTGVFIGALVTLPLLSLLR